MARPFRKDWISVVNVAAVSNMDNSDNTFLFVYLINRSVVPYSYAKSIAASQLEISCRPGILGKSTQSIAYPWINFAREVR
jgi:hypothetical protein